MLQATVVNSDLLESLPKTEVKSSVINHNEINQLIKNEEVESAIQVILTHFADMVADRVLARLGTVSTTVVSNPVEKTTVDTLTPTTTLIPSSEGVSTTPPYRKRHLSEETRKRMSESHKARWAIRNRHLTSESQDKHQPDNDNNDNNDTELSLNTPHEIENKYQDNSKIEISKIPKEAVLAVKEGYTGDPFYISEDGHFIGMDGFVVPKSFEEFIECHPKYIENWVRRRLNRQGIEEDIEDWCQDLIIHMKYLPPTSKHRNAGKTDVFQTFDPFSQYGASERRWRNYINYCLANKYNTIHGKRLKNPLCRIGNLSIASETTPEIHGEVTDEYVYSKSEYLSSATTREEKKLEDQFFTRAFIKYVENNDPDVWPILVAVYEAGSSADTIKEYCRTCQRLVTTIEMNNEEHKGHEIGMTPKEFNHARARLKQLADTFQKQHHNLTSVGEKVDNLEI